jgi:hypothetical protein
LHGSRGGGLCPPSDAAGQADAWDDDDDDGGSGGGSGDDDGEMAAQLAASGVLRPLVGEAPPDWALVDGDLPWPQIAATAAEVGVAPPPPPQQQQQEQQQEQDVDWASLVPEYGGSLAPLLQGLYDDEQEDGPFPSLSASDVLATFADADAGTARLRMLEIAAARRRQVGRRW